MIRTSLALTCFLAACPVIPVAARADEEWEQLAAEYDEAAKEWSQQLQKTHSDGEGSFTIKDPSSLPPHPADAFRPRVRAYAEKHAGHKDALPALGWLLMNSMGTINPMGGGNRCGWPIPPQAGWGSDSSTKHARCANPR